MIRRAGYTVLCGYTVAREGLGMISCGLYMLIVETIKGLFELTIDLILKPLQRMICRTFLYLTTEETRVIFAIAVIWVIEFIPGCREEVCEY